MINCFIKANKADPDEMPHSALVLGSTRKMDAKIYQLKLEMCPWDTDAPTFAKFASFDKVKKDN